MRKFTLPFVFLILLLYTGPAVAQTQTTIGHGAGEYQQLFLDLKKMLNGSRHLTTQDFGGKERQIFVRWIRDHVHVMKAMKYFSKDITSYWEFYMENQTEEGLFYDYYQPLESNLSHRMNLFDKRYWKILSLEKIQMHRIPVEADLEYLMVEGAWYIWQATGDNDFLENWLPGLERGLYYAMSDPLRWSENYQLVKRGYTLDTWDFMQLPASRAEYVRNGGDVQEGIFDIDENTPMGVMHGDNSGMYAACRQLARIYETVGMDWKSDVWANQAEIFRIRTNKLCWNGEYYAHFIVDDPMPEYLTMDQQNTLSLSNPYDINRGLPTDEMAQSIIETYRSLKDDNKLNSFAEWFGVYPPVEPHFADYEPGSYMNGGVNTIVAGELAKASFHHGYEKYGVDILNRIIELVEKHNGDLPVAYRPEGTVDSGIPDNWGQAAVMSALIEGLAGVVDNGQLFRSVEISPRWQAAGKNKVSVTVAYGPSGKRVSYDYDHKAGRKTIHLQLSGDPEEYVVRLLLPEGVQPAEATVNNKQVDVTSEKVRESIYGVINIKNVSEPVIIAVQYE